MRLTGVRQTLGRAASRAAGGGRWRVALRVFVLLALLPCAALFGAAVATPLPASLREGQAPSPSLRLLDRSGALLREVRAEDGARARWVPLAELGDRVPRALVAAEDRRFGEHFGVDPIAVIRAAGQALAQGRVVSGASTLTQQLARTAMPRPRTVSGKLLEMALALRIEASLSKRAILEQYLNRVTFGPGVRGVEAASRYYFDKPARDLSLAEAAALAGMPRGPSLYDPHRKGGLERLRRRRDRVLARLGDSGAATGADVARALGEPLVIAPRAGGFGAPHFAEALLSGALEPGLAARRPSALTTTIDRELQRELEALAQGTMRSLAHKHASAAAVVVLDNRTGEILGYVGSPSFGDASNLGQNDGVLAARQPGSALKPFVYELALERLGLTAASVLPDVDQDFAVDGGDYHPNNYDGRFHGPVRLREALANSYNVPAVGTASALGPERVLGRLRELGMGSLAGAAELYGVGIALGDGEVRLLDLANAYATLARGGVLLPVRAVRSATGATGEPLPLARAEATRVMDERRAYVITDVLSDRTARLASFGEGSVLELPFAAAVKTGTSKGYRDNVTVGYTPEVTVAVWVGNFDGSPMAGVSGVSGAGPLFHDALLAAARVRPPTPFVAPEGMEVAEVCSLSGARPTSSCPHRRRELFVAKSGAGGPPSAACAMHEAVAIDRQTGLLAGPGCPSADVDVRVFEAFSGSLAAWARAAGRPLAPELASPRCPGAPPDRGERTSRPRISFPLDGARFAVDPSLASAQSIRVRAEAPGTTRLRFHVDGRVVERGSPFFLDLPLVAGTHVLRVDADGVDPSEPVEFTVD